ncbi:MAG: adenylate/guanylate cyclase domain-containing protein, partial [Flavobacterium sp.]
MIYKTLIYLAIIISFLFVLTVIANAFELENNLVDKEVWSNAFAFFSSHSFLSVGLFMASIILICQFYIEVSDNIGQEVLTNLLKGKYHSPKVEERIYMFLDMKSSTTIAERLGHTRYFEMLKQYFSDLSDPVITYNGEIYQYVGDEMVVSWKLSNGLLNNNCIKCFFAMKAAIAKRSEAYIKTFGLVPDFKAGFHSGKVTTGEIGVIKKEIIFTGDVLNTTARIQELCNHLEVPIIIS